MRRRIVFAVIFVAAFIVLLRLAVVAGEFDTVVTAARFEAARDDRTALRAFLHRMPKGGDLHTHLAGAVYAERFIAWAAQQNLCANLAHVLLSKPQCDQPGDVPVADAMHDQNLYDRLVNAFSTRAFVPTVAVPTDHDKFFAAFDKFGAVTGSRFVDMVIDQLREYDRENVQYVEFMTSFFCSDDRDRFIAVMAGQTDDAGRLAALKTNGLDDCVTAKRNDLAAALGKIASELACDPQGTQSGCRVKFRFMAQILPRLHPPHADRRLPRQGRAGDPTRGRTMARLRSADRPYVHIRQAVEIAHARRIGHGVDIAFEHDMDGLLAEMRARSVVVEINLTSNDIILGVRGKDHPLPTYLAAGVPVVLSTDDAGVSRINLTNEYLRAARDYGLSYRTLKAIARNALTYSFLDEGQRRDELARFDRSSVEFERSVASGQSPLRNAVALITAAVTAP